MKRKIILLTLLLVMMCAFLSSCSLTSVIAKYMDVISFITGSEKDPAPVVTTTAAPVEEPEAPILFEDLTVEYSEGEEHAVKVENLPNGAVVTYKYGDKESNKPLRFSDAGAYEVTAVITKKDGSEVNLTATLTIEPKAVELNLGKITFVNGSAVFTNKGYEYKKASGFDSACIKAEYSYMAEDGTTVATMTDAGTYTVTATFKPANGNYTIANEKNPKKTATFTVTKPVYTFEEECSLDAEFPYTGDEKSTKRFEFLGELPRLPGGMSATYTYMQNGTPVTVPCAPGEYTVTVSLSAKNFEIAVDPALLTRTFTIVPQEADFGKVTVNESYSYTSETIYPEVKNLPNKVSLAYTYALVKTDENGEEILIPVDEMLAVGTYRVKIESYSLDGGWIGDLYSETVDVTVTPKELVPGKDIKFNGKTLTYDGNEKSHTISFTNPDLFEVVYRYTDANGNAVETMTNAGTYKVFADVTIKSKNYLFKDDLTEYTFESTLTVNPARLTIPSDLVFTPGVGIYNGKGQTYMPAYDPTVFNVTCVYIPIDENGNAIPGKTPASTATAAGIYKVVATFASVDPNYAVPEGAATLETTYQIFDIYASN